MNHDQIALDATAEELEQILISAMAWHPSENGPSYDETRNALRVRLAAVFATILGEKK